MRRAVTWLLLPTEVSYSTSALMHTSWLYGSPRTSLLIRMHTIRLCVLLLHMNISYIKAGHKRALCSPCILPIMLNLNGEPLWCPHTVTPHDPDPTSQNPPPHTVCWAAVSSRVSVMPCELTFEILPQLPSSIWLCSVTHHYEPWGVSWLGCGPEWVMSFDWLAAWVD